MDKNLEGQMQFCFGNDEEFKNYDEAYAAAANIQKELVKSGKYSILTYLEDDSVVLEYSYSQNIAYNEYGCGFLTAVSSEEFDRILEMREGEEEDE